MSENNFLIYHSYVLFFLYRQKAKNQKKKLVAENSPGVALLVAGGLV
ncbi:MAG: hypothetical protein Q7U71_00715 [bacterium]|nr:hypothetical protein [bacterium]